ncbi:MAG: hypothetical protein M1820_006706 [Bogoriella megaspora]|nr:MAG: hypothetical protein M1820_006706 [Bogoriella megaspora]
MYSLSRSKAFGSVARCVPTKPLIRVPAPIRNSASVVGQPVVEAGQEESPHQQVTLIDGRELGFAMYGASTGPALFHFHGNPSSRLEAADFDKLGRQLGARIIGVDRPGMGLSTFYPNRKLTNWPMDVTELAQYLGVDSFGVLGVSGGGPYALACARYIPPEQLRAVGVVAGWGPWDRETIQHLGFATWLRVHLYSRFPKLTEMSLTGRLNRLEKEQSTGSKSSIPHPMTVLAADSEKLSTDGEGANDGKLSHKIAKLQDSIRHGTNGNAEEIRQMRTPWGFKPEEVNHEGVRLWYGTEDQVTPIGIGRSLAKRLPGARLIEYEGLNHFEMGDKSKEIMEAMLEDVVQPQGITSVMMV